MEEQTKYNRSGIIKARIFAIVVLMLSSSLAISAFKSLGREFDGMVMHKETTSGFIQKNYDLFLNQNYKSDEHKQITNNDALTVLMGNFDDYTRVGVSKFAYQDAEPSMLIKKKQGSPIIVLNGTNYIDQGLFWAFISLLGMFISNLIYKQTLIKLPEADENKNEDLEI